MANVNIMPQEVLLTSGQAATFTSTDAKGNSVEVTWNLTLPPNGSFVNPATGALAPSIKASSAVYVAPTAATAQTIAVIATKPANESASPTEPAGESASATIYLTPDAIAIVPAKVELKAGQSQEFIAIVAGPPSVGAAPAPPGATTEKGAPAEKEGSTKKITWTQSPPLLKLDPNQTDLYKASFTAPPDIQDSTTVTIVATSKPSGKQAVAAVNLASPPWTGPAVYMLLGFLLLVFLLNVSFMVALWPPALPSPDAAKANRIEAERTLEDKNAALVNAETNVAKIKHELRLEDPGSRKREPPGTPGAVKTSEDATTLAAANASADPSVDPAELIHKRALEAQTAASKDLDEKRDDERTVNSPYVEILRHQWINRELDLLLLVLLAGSLGSFLHVAQSYSDYVGNKTLKRSWASWYCFRPFIGAGLALVVYAAGRGGVMAIASGSNAKASELNPFGLVAVAAMVGMFSKAATTKLGEVFDTLFKSDKAKENKDKLVQSSQTSSQSAGTTPAGGPAASAATK
ncbi:MAG: hypothetical protein P4N24_14565 [Acidobacteriota bacterium]|nr:hypothetical protein [Acidobacteriota bacterium]